MSFFNITANSATFDYINETLNSNVSPSYSIYFEERCKWKNLWHNSDPRIDPTESTPRRRPLPRCLRRQLLPPSKKHMVEVLLI